jgi:hypothetical protein
MHANVRKRGRRTTGEARLAVVLGHPSPLVVPAVLADTASHICGIGAVLEVAAAGCRERSLEFCRPLPVGLGQSPHLVRRHTKVTEHRGERLAAVDRVQELVPDLGG